MCVIFVLRLLLHEVFITALFMVRKTSVIAVALEAGGHFVMSLT